MSKNWKKIIFFTTKKKIFPKITFFDSLDRCLLIIRPSSLLSMELIAHKNERVNWPKMKRMYARSSAEIHRFQIHIRLHIRWHVKNQFHFTKYPAFVMERARINPSWHKFLSSDTLVGLPVNIYKWYNTSKHASRVGIPVINKMQRDKNRRLD